MPIDLWQQRNERWDKTKGKKKGKKVRSGEIKEGLQTLGK